MRILKYFLLQVFVVIVIFTLLVLYSELSKSNRDLRYFSDVLDQSAPKQVTTDFKKLEGRGKPMTKVESQAIALAFTQAWDAFARAQYTETLTPLKAYFSGAAYKRVQHVVENFSDKNRKSFQIFLRMDADVDFFHFDGGFTQFSSKNAKFARFVLEDDELLFHKISKDCTLSNMMVKQTGWHIINHQKTCQKEILPRPNNHIIPDLKGINYYPFDKPWRFFWEEYNPEQVISDIKKIKKIGFNSVRIFLPYETFATHHNDHLNNLEHLLKTIAREELYIVPTLFDFRGELTPWTWSNDISYLENILPKFQKFQKNIAFVDVKNEFDLDKKYQSAGLMEAWARTMILYIRHKAPELPLTMGWSNSEQALWLAEWLDVISYHDYEDIDSAKERLQKLQLAIKEIDQNKPIYVTEIGYTSYDLLIGFPSDETKQAEKTALHIDALEKANGLFLWNYSDFIRLDQKAIGGTFWNKSTQANFGLYRKDQTEKPIIEVIKQWTEN